MMLNFCSLSTILHDLKQGKLTHIELIEHLCDRIDMYEGDIKAFLPEKGKRARLLKELAKLEETYPNPEERPPLFGIPMGVKDIFNAEGFETRAGSNLPPHLFFNDKISETEAVTRLKDLGVLVMGKTVSTEFAYFNPGPTANPHNLNHTPGGSSSGSAASVAAGFLPLALGTQTIGSVSRPAAFCGIYGFKPTYDRIKSTQLVYFSPSFDHIGFFTQDFEGLKFVAGLLCEAWEETTSEGKPVIGIPDITYLDQADPKQLEFFNSYVEDLRKNGYEVIDTRLFDDIEKINRFHRELIAKELAEVHTEWFAQYEDLYSDKTRDLILKGKEITQDGAESCLKFREISSKSMRQITKKSGVDIWISPSAPHDAPEGLDATGDPIMNLPWTFLGVPTIAAPTGKSERGLPLGIQFAGAFGKDEKLFSDLSYLKRDDLLKDASV